MKNILDAFSSAVFRDSHLKNRIIAWTFAVLVLPTALIVAAGVPEKPAYIAMAVLILPLQYAVYTLTSKQRSATHRSALLAPMTPVTETLELSPKIAMVVLTHPDDDSAILSNILGRSWQYQGEPRGIAEAMSRQVRSTSPASALAHAHLKPENKLHPVSGWDEFLQTIVSEEVDKQLRLRRVAQQKSTVPLSTNRPPCDSPRFSQQFAHAQLGSSALLAF